MKTNLLLITVLVAIVTSIASCVKKDLTDCLYEGDEAACERLDDAETSLESTMYQTPDSVQVNEQQLPSLD